MDNVWIILIAIAVAVLLIYLAYPSIKPSKHGCWVIRYYENKPPELIRDAVMDDSKIWIRGSWIYKPDVKNPSPLWNVDGKFIKVYAAFRDNWVANEFRPTKKEDGVVVWQKDLGKFSKSYSGEVALPVEPPDADRDEFDKSPALVNIGGVTIPFDVLTAISNAQGGLASRQELTDMDTNIYKEMTQSDTEEYQEGVREGIGVMATVTIFAVFMTFLLTGGAEAMQMGMEVLIMIVTLMLVLILPQVAGIIAHMRRC